MKSASAFLILAGVLAGPGYYLYCEALSGERVGSFQGSDLRIDLDPAMNPLSFSLLTAENNQPSDKHYTATLTLGERTIMGKSFVVAGTGLGHQVSSPRSESVVLGLVSVPSAGQYRFVLSDDADPKSAAPADIEIRRNAREAEMTVVWTGAALLLAGLLRLFSEGRGGG